MSDRFAKDISPAFQLEMSVTVGLCESVDSPRSLCVALLLRHGEWQQLLDLKCDPSHYTSDSQFADDYLVTEVLRKSPNIPLGIDRKEAALTSFYEAESQCKATNRSLLHNPPSWLSDVRREIRNILGPLTLTKLKEVERAMAFGPGATTGVTGMGSVPSDKFDAQMHLTAELYPFYRSILGDPWWEHQANPLVVVGNRFATVPKTALTDRGICIEPTLNIFVQKAVGQVLRRLLARSGINLNTQERNRYLSRQAYILRLATIDLSKASDTVSLELVKSLFPDRWFVLLDLCRSKYTQLPNGEFHELEKFSSMGNGFTFELETLIFWALIRTVVPIEERQHCAVYGDDIIVPQDYAAVVVERLGRLGFQVNEKKSFLAGSFFESCGTDWFEGRPVRPFYLRGAKGKIPYALQIANRLRSYLLQRTESAYSDARFRPVWERLIRLVPREWLHAVPEEFGDTGILCLPEEIGRAPWRRHPTLGLSCVRHIHLKPRKLRKATLGLWWSVLAGNQSNHRSLMDILRNDEPLPPYSGESRRGLYGRLVSKVALHEGEPNAGLYWC
jgi:hypothetical protein